MSSNGKKEEQAEHPDPEVHDSQSGEEWEDENPEDEAEGFIIGDGMELEFDSEGEIIGVKENADESANTDMDPAADAKGTERPPYVVGTFVHHMDEVVSIGVNPVNETEFATGGMDDQLVFWDAISREPVQTFKFKETVAFVDFGFDGKMLAAGTLDDKIRVFEKGAEGWGQRFELSSTSDELTSMTFHKKGNVLLTSHVDGTANLWNCNIGKLMTTFYGHSGTVNTAAFTPDGKFLATASEDATLKMWRVSSNAEKFTIAGKTFHTANILALSFHDTKPLMATGGEDEVFCVSNSDHGEVYFKSPEVAGVVEAVCFGSTLDALSIGTSEGDLAMYDLQKFKRLAEFQADSPVNGIKFWEAQRSFVTSTVSGELILNGFGSKAGHQRFPVLVDEPINDFRLKGEFGILLCTTDSQVFEVDIRKGVL